VCRTSGTHGFAAEVEGAIRPSTVTILVDLRPDLSANDIDEWDSLRHVQLIMAVEKAFGIRFQTGEVEVAKNVGQFIDLIERHLSQKKNH
jgi:acyl carrier protein